MRKRDGHFVNFCRLTPFFVASDRSHSISVILHAKSCDIEADQIALIPWAAKETDHGA